MQKRWAPAFTIIELSITIVVIGVLITVATFGYNGVQRATATRAVQSDLTGLAAEMQRLQLNSAAYPTDIPSTFSPSTAISLTMKRSGATNFYPSLTPVQQGVLFAQTCQELIDEGVGKGVNTGGQTQEYVSGCGQWNYNSTQVTGWTTKQWNTPVSEAQLTTYADTFTTSDSFNKTAHEATVKKFYSELVGRYKDQGGTFPLTTFWDYWAAPGNGGVPQQPLSTPQKRLHYCVEAQSERYTEVVWHVTEEAKLRQGTC